jgi:hypothetical protein
MFGATTAKRGYPRSAQSRPGLESGKKIDKEQRAPVSVLPNLESLVGLRWHDGPDVRPVLLRILTDLYIQKPSHSTDEEQQYVELSLRLLDAVDASVRTEIGRRLAAYGGAPTAVLRRLLAYAAVSEPIVEQSAAAHSTDAGPALASFTPAGLPSFGSNFRAMAHELNEIFFAASPAERRLIVMNLDYSNAVPTQSMSAAYTDEANRDLETAALQGRLDEFIRKLESAMKISREHAQRIVNDPWGEPLVIAARALEMPIDILQRILLCVNPAIGHSVRRVYSLSALYRDMTLESGLRLLAIWRAASPITRVTTEQQPKSSDDDSRGLRDFAAIPRPSSSRSTGEAPRHRHQRTR